VARQKKRAMEEQGTDEGTEREFLGEASSDRNNNGYGARVKTDNEQLRGASEKEVWNE